MIPYFSSCPRMGARKYQGPGSLWLSGLHLSSDPFLPFPLSPPLYLSPQLALKGVVVLGAVDGL